MMVNLLAHENLIRRALDKSLRRLTREMLENQANPPVLESDSADGITILPTPAEFKMLKMLNDTGYSLANISSTVSQLRARIEKEARDKELHAQKTEQHIQKTRQAEEAHQLRMYGKMKGEVLADAFALLQGDNGSAQKAAMFLEMRGITVPDTIRRLLDIEMEQERNKVDESTGITAEELDAYVAAAEAKRAGHHEWLANKRQIVAAIVDEHGYGDLDEDGVRRSDEIQAPFQPGEKSTTAPRRICITMPRYLPAVVMKVAS
jgi:DNA-binding transcriptional MerR regulator